MHSSLDPVMHVGHSTGVPAQKYTGLAYRCVRDSVGNFLFRGDGFRQRPLELLVQLDLVAGNQLIRFVGHANDRL
jgi:hypothetical protein